MRYAKLSCLLIVATLAWAQDARELASAAMSAYQAKNYEESARLFDQAITAGDRSSATTYNAACSHALAGDSAKALDLLDQAVAAGWFDAEHLEQDRDLSTLRGETRWPGIVERCKAAERKHVQSLKNPELHRELVKRMRADQAIRMQPNPNFREMERIDRENTAWLKQVVDRHGWPTISMVGERGELAAFLLIQHADPAQELEFQKRCLELMKAAMSNNDVRKSSVAYLTDRLLMHQGLKQIYGTQFRVEEGELKLYPIQDEAGVDARRKEVGLPPLAEYERQMREMQFPASQPAN